MQRILVVDDDPEILSLLKRGLSYEGYAVETASNGAEALSKAREKEPDLVVLDVMMPEMDGVEVARRLRRMLGNLIDNAIKYTPEGGTITLSLYREGGRAKLEVADTGIGIAPEHLPHIFDRFYRVDKARSRASGGTGLGLAIVRSIAEQHGGKVTVTSAPGKGSIFTVWLGL
jgi:signal transduction histidine kinase